MKSETFSDFAVNADLSALLASGSAYAGSGAGFELGDLPVKGGRQQVAGFPTIFAVLALPAATLSNLWTRTQLKQWLANWHDKCLSNACNGNLPTNHSVASE